MARLRTLGSVELIDATGRAVDAILSRQRRVALLVYLAVEGRAGFVRRESLFPVFWPELDQARARAALRQSLYVLRSEVGEDVLVARGAEEVGLSDALDCDATAFQAHADAGRFAEARALYRGPFLNGFFISDAPEFERWVDERRAAIRRRAAECDHRLAVQARERGDIPGAARHLRQALELDATDEPTLRALMEVLDASGDRAAALREYAQFAEALRRDLELAPSPETEALAAAIRSGARDGDPSRAAARQQWLATAAAVTPGESPSRAPRLRRWQVAAGLLVAAAGIGGAAVATRTRASDRTEPRLVVMPFTVRAAPELAYLGEGMSDLLSTSLDGPELFRAVPPVTVIRDVRGRGDASAPERAAATARRFGAAHFVQGTVVAVENRIRFDAQLFATAQPASASAQVSVEGSPDSIFALVDQLAARIIAESRGRGPAQRLRGSAAMTTRSLAALRDYLSGERAYRDGSFAAAMQFFRKAVATDSTFALAYYRMSMAAEWQGALVEALALAAEANRHASRLSMRDGALLRAHYTMLRTEPLEAERQYRAILTDSPDDAEAWLKIGEILFHNNSQLGRPLRDAAEAFERVLSYEPDHRAALLHLIRIAAYESQQAKLDSLAIRYLSLGLADGSRSVRLLAALSRRGAAEVAALARSASSAPDEEVQDAGRDALMFGRDPAAAVAVLRANLAGARSTERRALTYLQLAAIELTRGRRDTARTHFRSAAAAGFPAAAAQLDAFYALYTEPAPPRADLVALQTSVASARSGARNTPARAPILAQMNGGETHLREALLAELALRLGDTAAARAHARAIGARAIPPGLEWLQRQLSQMTQARLAAAEGNHAAAAALLSSIRHTDSLVPVNRGFPWHGVHRIALADELAATDRALDALPLLSSFEHQSVFLYPFIAVGEARRKTLDAGARRR